MEGERREREREKERQRQRDRDRGRQTERQTEKESEMYIPGMEESCYLDLEILKENAKETET